MESTWGSDNVSAYSTRAFSSIRHRDDTPPVVRGSGPAVIHSLLPSQGVPSPGTQLGSAWNPCEISLPAHSHGFPDSSGHHTHKQKTQQQNRLHKSGTLSSLHTEGPCMNSRNTRGADPRACSAWHSSDKTQDLHSGGRHEARAAPRVQVLAPLPREVEGK